MKHKYEEVAECIIDWAKSGKYKPHEKIPTESELMAMFNVSRHTIRKAIDDLVNMDYVYKIQGSGIYISNWTENISNMENHKNIAVLTTHISNYIFPDIIRGMEDTIYSESFSLLLSSTNNNVMFENSNLKNLLAHKIDGLILEPTKSAFQSQNIGYLNNVIERNIPFLMINASYAGLNVPSLRVDDFKGGKLAAKHLIELNHKNIMGIFKVDDFQGINRMNGFISECEAYNILLSPWQVVTYLSEEIDFSLPKKIETILQSENRPTGIFCYNDEIAFLVSNIAKRLEIKIPKELSIIGFDDSSLAKIMYPKLTSVTHPKKQMGIDAAKLIIKLIKNNNEFNNEDSILYEPKLIVRDSTFEIKD